MDGLFTLMKQFRKLIILFWLSLTIICSFWALRLPDYTEFELKPPNGYDSGIAYDKMKQYFPKLIDTNYELILIQKHDAKQASIINTETHNIYDEIKDKLLNQVNIENDDMITSISAYYDFNVSSSTTTPQISNIIKNKFIEKKEEIMLVILTLDTIGITTVKIDDLTTDIVKTLESISAKYDKYSIVLTGPTAMFVDVLNTFKRDITGRDLYILPVVFGFMIYILGSWKLIIIPICSLIMSIIISFAFILPFAKYEILKISPVTPTMMLFVTMAISVDYSLFLLSRFSSQIRNGSNTNHAVKEMLRFSGQVVILSALILILCYLGLSLFPIVNTIGYGTSVAIMLCAAINITFSCSLILAFPTFYSDLAIFPSIITNCFQSLYDKYYLSHTNDRASYRITNNTSVDTDDCEEKTDSDTSIDSDHDEIQQQEVDKQVIECRKNIYFKMAQFTTSKPYNYIFPIMVYSIMIPIIITGFIDYKASLDDTIQFDPNAKSVKAYHTLINHFSAGILNPMTILAVNNQGDDIWNKEYFQDSCGLGNALINELQYKSTDLMSVAFISSTDNSVDCLDNDENMNLFKQTMETGIIPQEIENKYPQYYWGYFSQSVSTENNNYGKASIIQIKPNFNSYTESGATEGKSLRNVVQTANKMNVNTNFYINNLLYWKLDLLTELYSRMPWALSIIIVVIFGLVGIVYKAFLLPFRLLLCIVIPILFVYATTSLIYKEIGIYWITPCMTMTVLIGLALDYEIFLFSRIYELRKKGYTTKASIILGVAMSGPIITSAGTVMILAFTGLLIQPMDSVIQMGFIFAFGVFCDAFIIRPLIVPSLLSIGGEKTNWWPTKMPLHHLKDEYGQYVIVASYVATVT